MWELWGALLYGGRLVVVPHCDQPLAAQAFADLLAASGVTVLDQTPSAFRAAASTAPAARGAAGSRLRR